MKSVLVSVSIKNALSFVFLVQMSLSQHEKENCIKSESMGS